jgi:putative membrane protein
MEVFDVLMGNAVLFMQTNGGVEQFDPHYWEKLMKGVLGTLIFGSIGILLAALGFKVFDWITPRLDIERELGERNNLAVAILMGAVILGVCYIIATAVH